MTYYKSFPASFHYVIDTQICQAFIEFALIMPVIYAVFLSCCLLF